MARNARFTSRVKIDDERPYRTLFASADGLLERRTGMSAVVGPKISSCAIRISGSTSAKTVGR